MPNRKKSDPSPGFLVFLVTLLVLAALVMTKCSPARVSAIAVQAAKE